MPDLNRGVSVAVVMPKELVRYIDEQARRDAEGTYRAPNRSDVIRKLVARAYERDDAGAGQSGQAA